MIPLKAMTLILNGSKWLFQSANVFSKCPLTMHARGPFDRLRTARLDSHRQIGFVGGFGFVLFRRQISSLQPPACAPKGCIPYGDDVASR